MKLPWKAKKYLENHENSLKNEENHEKPWNYLENHKTTSKPTKLLWRLRNPTKNREKTWYYIEKKNMKLPQKPRYFFKNRESQSRTVKNHETNLKIMEVDSRDKCIFGTTFRPFTNKPAWSEWWCLEPAHKRYFEKNWADPPHPFLSRDFQTNPLHRAVAPLCMNFRIV